MDRFCLPVVARSGIATTLSDPYAFPGMRIVYPSVVTQALVNLYREYNAAFGSLVEANREWCTDYQYAVLDGAPINWGVQIDMAGINNAMMARLAHLSEAEVREILRLRIFELENSLALYSILDRVCDRCDGSRSSYSDRFRGLLDSIRCRFRRPIALLAVTDDKHNAMRETEFGKRPGEILTDDVVREISGFDRLFGPEDFRAYLASNGGRCDYLLYCRTSDPVIKLRKPSFVVEHPLISDPVIRETIKANSITLNVDNPSWPRGDRRCINDTKDYMPPMGMAFAVTQHTDLFSDAFIAYLGKGEPAPDFVGDRLSHAFTGYLTRIGACPQAVSAGQVRLRIKPAQGAYGCYGHERGVLTDGDFIRKFRLGVRDRGSYLVQIEQPQPEAHNEANGRTYAYIDRVFVGTFDDGPELIGGFREFLDAESVEAKAGRLHGNRETVFGEIAA